MKSIQKLVIWFIDVFFPFRLIGLVVPSVGADLAKVQPLRSVSWNIVIWGA